MLVTGHIYRLEGYGGLLYQELLKASNKRGIKEEKERLKY